MIDYEKRSFSKMRVFNVVFRIGMWCASIGLFVSTFFMQDCHSAIYPRNFFAVTAIIFLHQIYDIYLACNGYMQHDQELPAMPSHGLWWNKELFQK